MASPAIRRSAGRAGRRLRRRCRSSRQPATWCWPPVSGSPACRSCATSPAPAPRWSSPRTGRHRRSWPTSPVTSPSPATCRQPPDGTTLVVTSAGIPPTNPLLAAALAAGIEVIGEVELAWRLDQAERLAPGLAGGDRDQRQDHHHRHARVDPAGRRPAGHGQRQHRLAGARGRARRTGSPDWVADEPRQDVIAVELSSFQLHWAPSHPAGRRRGAERRRGSPGLARVDGRLRRCEGRRADRPGGAGRHRRSRRRRPARRRRRPDWWCRS